MRRMPLNTGWTFSRNGGPEVPVTLPHDAMLGNGRSPQAPSGAGGAYFLGGTYTYERVIDAPATWANKRVLLELEAVYRDAIVSLNGAELARHAYGYTSFRVDLTPALRLGEPNVLQVACANVDQPDSRWYSGAGITRPAWLWIGATQAAITPDALRVTTVSLDPATVDVDVTGVPAGAHVRVEIRDGQRTLACAHGRHVTLELPGAPLWSEDAPHLLTCRATALTSSASDVATVTFGLRTMAWGDAGLLVNDKPVLLRGGCIHSGDGVLGAAEPDEAAWRRVRRLREQGFNAIRSAHNPCSRALLEAADALGVYVVDESWDMWYQHKNPHDYATDWEANRLLDLDAMVARDFDHPSVIAYSVGNELSEPHDARGLAALRELVDHLHAADPTRPVTAGINLSILALSGTTASVYGDKGGLDAGSGGALRRVMSGMDSTTYNMLANATGGFMEGSAATALADRATSPAFDLLDICGYNYGSSRYYKDARLHPHRVIYGSETFPKDLVANWRAVERLPLVVGDFVWAAWDYIGEVGVGAWAYTPDGAGYEKPYPWLLAGVGLLDLCGNPGGEAFLARAARHQLPHPQICVRPVTHAGERATTSAWRCTDSIPSWAWRGCEGRMAEVEVYAERGSLCELFLNGRSLGRRHVVGCVARFHARWEPGRLRAVVMDELGQPISTCELASAGDPWPTLLPECDQVAAGGVAYVDLAMADVDGVVESCADVPVSVVVEGGELLGLGSARPRSTESFLSGHCTTYYGRALAVVRAGAPGRLTLRAETDSGQVAEVTLPVVAADGK